jgi:hypothetical protein
MHNFMQFMDQQDELVVEFDSAHDRLTYGDTDPLVKLLDGLCGKLPARAMTNFSDAALRIILSAFWLNAQLTCLPELALCVDPHPPQRQGCSGFIDLFFPRSPAVCIKLVSISLEALQRGNNRTLSRDSYVSLEELRVKLREETEEQLLERNVMERNEITTSIKQVKEAAFEQLTCSLDVMKNGVADINHTGVHDYRIKQGDGKGQLVGYVVLLLGGTRTLAWHVEDRETDFLFQVTEEAESPSILP